MRINTQSRLWLSLVLGSLLSCPPLLAQAQPHNCPQQEDFYRTALLYNWRQGSSACSPATITFMVSLLRAATLFDEDILRKSETTHSDNPTLTLEALETDIDQRGVVYLSTHGSDPDTSRGIAGGDPAVEYFVTKSAAEARAYDYYIGFKGYEPTWIEIAHATEEGAWVITLRPAGITSRVNKLVAGAFAHFEYCYSKYTATFWSNLGTGLGYDLWIAAGAACTETQTVWARLGCAEPGAYPSAAHAVSGQQLEVCGEPTGVISCGLGCLNQATLYSNIVAFVDSGASQATIGFQTNGEIGSSSHTVRGFAIAADYPGAPDTLAIVAADGGPGILRCYASTVADGYLLYDVAEEDSNGAATWSDPVTIGTKPINWDSLGDCRWDEPVMTYGSDTLLYVAEGETLIPYVPASSFLPDTSSRYDYVIYTRYQTGWLGFVQAAAESLQAQGLRVRVLTGDYGFESLRQVLRDYIANNAAYNASCSNCSHVFPVDPGPTLLICGDAWPEIIYPLTFPDNGQCLGNNCHSYSLIADLDNDSIPDCPVEVIPGDSPAEILRMVNAGADFARGRFLDSGEHVLLVGGDRIDGVQAGWLHDFIARTKVLYEVHAMSPFAAIYETDYPVGDNYAGVQTAVRDDINDGALEAWFFGSLTNTLKFPAWCISSISDPSYLTTKQRMVFWAPGCMLGGVWWPDSLSYNQAPTMEKMAFNDPQKTMMAGGVFHLDPGYETRHLPWAEILRDTRMYALPGTPVSRVHYDAMQAWFDQFPGDNYVLSTYAVGAHVLVPDAATSVPPGDSNGTAAVPHALGAWGNVGQRPSFRFSLGQATRISLRIVDVSGRYVTTLREAELPSGPHQFTWLGKDRFGKDVGSGVYFGVLTTRDGRRDVAKVVIIR